MMNILNLYIDYVIKETVKTAEGIKAEKIAAITELEGKLDTCPQIWISATKRFIELIRDNIVDRQRLIDELNNISSVDEPKRVLDIVQELEVIDEKDCRAVDFYSAVMDEME